MIIIFKNSKINKLSMQIDTNDYLPENFKKEYGSCMLAAEIITKKLLGENISDFKIIEGYISFPGAEWEDQHTWIETKDGKIIDPTSSQWGHKNIIYLKHNRKSYTPKQYLSLCNKFPVPTEKYFKKYTYL